MEEGAAEDRNLIRELGLRCRGAAERRLCQSGSLEKGLKLDDYCFGVTPLVQSQSFGLGEAFQWLLSRCMKGTQ